MKHSIFILTFLLSLQILAQKDTLKFYYVNGQLSIFTTRLNGKPHGESKTWFENGQLSSVGFWRNGKEIRIKRYYETGQKKSLSSYYKWKTKNKMWHPNGQLWDVSKSKYSRSTEKTYDSSGVLVLHVVEKKGTSLSCALPLESDPSDSTIYKDGSCVCSWGKVYWRNGVWIDEKGRDLNSDYSYTRFDYYSNGSIQKETIWNNEMKMYNIREWDKNGKLISENAM